MKQSKNATIQVEPLQVTTPNQPTGGNLTLEVVGLNDVPIEARPGVPPGKVYLINTDNMIVQIPHELLLKALYWVYDFMDRAMINFFLVGDTAQAVIDKKDLFGDKITVGVRKMEWESGSRRIADSFATPVKDDGNIVYYEFEGVPVVLYVLEDDATIQSPDQQMYKSEFFKLPNPYGKFLETFGEVIK